MEQLKQFFAPKSIAVIGASAVAGKVGNDVIMNLKSTYRGAVYPINPKEAEIEGIKVYPSIAKTPTVPDLAIVVIPAEFVPTVVEECGKRGCRNLVVISAGFKEIGGTGIELENKLLELKKKYKLRILGPNCLGYINVGQKTNASFAEAFPKFGNVGFFSQSGALGTAVLDTAEAQKLGLSHFISVGNKSDINELDLLAYLGEDQKTKVILAYLESITNGVEFMELAKKVGRKKPIVVLKSGKTEAGMKAVSSHTGSLAGSAIVYSAAFKQAGIIEAEDAMDFFDLAEGFAYQNYPAGNRVAILTNAGGPGILLTDYLPNYGMKLAELSAKTQAELKEVLPTASNVHNPVDVLGDALADRYEKAFKILIKDKNIDTIIVALTPQRMTQIPETTTAIGKWKLKTDKTVVCCFMGELETIKNYQFFADNKLPQFNYPQETVKVLGKMYEYGQWHKNNTASASKTNPIKLNPQLKSGTGLVTADLARQILLQNKFPLHRAEFAKDVTAAAAVAKAIGYPVAIQVVSKQVVHKSDVGGVKIGISNEEELIKVITEMNKKVVQKVPGAKIDGFMIGEMVKGQEVIVGLKRDSQFGAVVMLGLGGIYTEVFKDVAFKVAPFTLGEAQAMIRELKIYPLLTGARGQKPADIEALAELLVRFGNFALANPSIKEIDFNPVMVLEKGKGVKIVDNRILM